ncbi:MAG: nucleotidyltransferase family protein, partial [bacterium]|nr:nucleotidyltransferase family protein [bacterium]
MLNQEYREMLQLFEKYKVKYLIVGAYALAAHGYPRSTGDIDLWVKPESDNAKRVFRAMAEFGAPLVDVNEETFSYPGVVYQIG